ncbi:MAG: dTDP-4-dehydrorhamnose reductase [Methanobacteriaceae archaeon]
MSTFDDDFYRPNVLVIQDDKMEGESNYKKLIFVTGGSGLLGSKFNKDSFEEYDKYDIIKTFNRNPENNCISLDITDHSDVLAKIESSNPDLVIHSAALTNVDYCEDHQNEAYEINVKGTENIVKACEKIDCKLIYVSTDFVFDGKKGMYDEDEKTNPLGYYALTKLQGEKLVQNSNLNYAISRVSVLYGWHRRLNFVTWVINELKLENEINVVTDQYNSPTFADNAAEAMIKIFEKDRKGTYHIAGDERISRFDFAKNIAEVFDLDKNLINPVKSSEFVQKAKRPKDSSLSIEKARKDLKIKMLNTIEGLKEMKKFQKICDHLQ